MDTMNNTTLILFFIAIILSRYINTMAMKKLSTEKKAELLDTFSSFSIWSILPLLVLIVIFYVTLDYIQINDAFYIFFLYIFFIIIYIIGIQVYIFKKLDNLEYPISYIKQYLLSVFVRFIGLIALASPMIITLFSEK